MTEPIKPALTPEEWKAFRPVDRADEIWRKVGDEYESGPAADSEIDFHSVAAITLYGQPFGFTREDVLFLREVLHVAERSTRPGGAKLCTSLADRIEALLPPEAK